jgi:hypothetical protein
MPEPAAIPAIESYIRKCGQDYSQWCVGVAADPVNHMLNHHRVSEEGDGCGWITYHCADAAEARAARDHFIAKGMRTATAKATTAVASIYVFKITATTRL